MIAAVLALWLTGCNRAEPVHRTSHYVFGTTVAFRIVGSNADEAERAVGRVMETFNRLHVDWHAWNDDGALARINLALAEHGTAELPDNLVPLVRDGLALARATDGLFDPTIGALSSIWGFHTNDPNDTRAPPSDADLAKWLAEPPSWRNLRLDGAVLSTTHPDVRLDFGGYAKGAALEMARDSLAEDGIHNALINAGGDIVAMGNRDDRPWRIGIRDPATEDGVLASVEANDGEALFTSGDYERGFRYKGRLYHHVLDPRTARPVRGARAVTVLHEDAGVADAAATALLVAGPGDWARLAAAMGIKDVLLVRNDGSIELTPSMKARIRFEGNNEPAIRVVR